MKRILCSACILSLGFFTAPTTPGADAPDTYAQNVGIIEGVITFRGDIPKSEIPDNAGVRHDLLEVDRKTRGLRYVVVWLDVDPNEQNIRIPERPGLAAVDQRNYEFVPRVLGVRSGEPVEFINSDPANHNVRTSSNRAANEFNVFTGIDSAYTHRFVSQPKQAPIRLACDVHPWMRGWIYVFDHPWFSVTDERGRFRLASVPPGDYVLVLRQPDIRYKQEKPLSVSKGNTTQIRIEVEEVKTTKENGQP